MLSSHCAQVKHEIQKAPQILVPTLSPGDVVVMDNLGSHKSAGVRAGIEAAAATLLYPPPCSPDFNPAEKAFSKLKALLRKAAERNVEALWNRIGALLHEVTPPTSSPPQAMNRLEKKLL